MFKSIGLSLSILLISLFMKAQTQSSSYLIYVGDPMCSWCYGFAPELKKINSNYGDELGLQVVVGGLRPYGTQPMDTELAEFLREHWVEIEQRSGEKFNFGILDNRSFILDTEPSCRAYKVLEGMGLDKIPAFHEIQKVFYVDNADPKDVNSFKTACENLGVPFEKLKSEFESENYKKLTYQDFQIAKQMGVTGFPTLLLMHNEKGYVVSRGYQKAEALISQIDKIIKE